MPRGGRKTLLLFIFACCILATAAFYVKRPFGNWLYEKGIEAKKEWRLEDAIEYFSWAARFSDLPNDAAIEKAACFQLHGDFIKSQVEYESLLATSTLSQRSQAQILNSNGINLFNQNQPEKALLSHKESLKIAGLINDKKLEAQALVELSRVLYHSKGKFDEARFNLDQALKLGREIGDELIVADSLRNIGVVLWWGKGELDRPLKEYYEPALALYRKHHDRRGEATMLSNISLIHLNKNDNFKYMKLQNESFAIREEIKDQAGISESYKAFGSVYSNMRNLKKGREFFLRSIKLSKQIGFRLTQNEAESYLAGIYVDLGEYDEAIALFSQILEREKDSPALRKNRLGAIGNCYLLKGDLERAREYMDLTLEISLESDSQDIRALFASYVFLSEIHMRLGDFENAKKMLEKSAEYYSENAGLIQGHFGYGVTQAEFFLHEKDPDRSLQFLKDAADIELSLFAASGTNVISHPRPKDHDRLFSILLEKLKSENSSNASGNDPAEELAFRFLEQRRYRSFRNFIVQSGTKYISSTAASEEEKNALIRIQKINEEIKTGNDPAHKKRLYEAYSEYENTVIRQQYSKEIRQAISAAQPADLKTVQDKLDEKTALIEYIFAGEKVFALVLTKSKLRSFALPATRSNLRNKIRLLQGSLNSKDKDTGSINWTPITEDLRQSLIDPIERSNALEGIDRLAIVPYSVLHDLPFAALTKNENGQTRFLIEDYVLFFPPSASFLTTDETPKQTKRLISFGRNETATRELPPLKFAVEESRLVAEIFSGEARLENDANETEFKEFASKVTHLHIAAHAFAEPDMPLFSRLILRSSEKDDGNVTTKEVFELGIDTDLVTIAACEGARSFSADSEGLVEIDRIGLTEAFLHAGSKSVLASLAPVSDKATMDLMKDFYRNLLTQDKAASLALAQRKILHTGNSPQFEHPRFWANFVLIGTDR